MGKKQSGARQYLYFCVACLISIALYSCVPFQGLRDENTVKEEAAVKIRNAIKHLEQGNYDAAMEENTMALTMFPHIPIGDEALFNMGLIHAHHKYPRKDYKKSISFFERLLRDYPESSLAEQARIWLGVLLTIEKSKEVDIRIQEMKKELLR